MEREGPGGQEEAEAEEDKGVAEDEASGAASPSASHVSQQQARQQEQAATAGPLAQEGGSMLDFVLAQPPGTAAPAGAGRAGAPAPAARGRGRGPAPEPQPAAGVWHLAAAGEGAGPEGSLQVVSDLLREKPGWRAMGEVVAVVQPSRRRESVIGERVQAAAGRALLFACACVRGYCMWWLYGVRRLPAAAAYGSVGHTQVLATPHTPLTLDGPPPRSAPPRTVPSPSARRAEAGGGL